MYGITAPTPVPYDENNLATWNRDQLERALREKQELLNEVLSAVQNLVDELPEYTSNDGPFDHLAPLFVSGLLEDPRKVQEDLDYEVTVTLNVRVSAEFSPIQREEVVADILSRLERTDFTPEISISDGDDLAGSWSTVDYEISEVDVTDPSQDVSTNE